MQAINWIDWLQDPFKQAEYQKVQEDDYIWQDPVTKTIFKISKNEYEDLLILLKNQLAESTAEDCYSLLSSSQIPFGKSAKLEIAPQIPYPEPIQYKQYKELKLQSPPMRTRIADHILLRAGLYFAIHNPCKEEWRQIRKKLLQVDCDISPMIEKFIREGIWEGDNQAKIDIVKAGAVKIKQYLLETNNIQEIRGASILLDDINQNRIFDLMSKKWTKESLIYSGGGNFLIILPAGTGEKCAAMIEEMFENDTVSAQSIAVSENVSMAQLSKDKFSNTLSWIEMKKTERQMTKLLIEPNAHLDHNNPHDEKLKNIYIFKSREIPRDKFQLTINGEPICKLCRRRIAKLTIGYKEQATDVCSSCLQKIVTGRNEDMLIDQINNIITRFYNKSPYEEFTNTLSDISDDYIAVVYGDGNNMGFVVASLDSFQKFRYFSHLTDSITKSATYITIFEVLSSDEGSKKKNEKESVAKFEIIAVGGDDLFFIVPGDCGLRIARLVGQKFDQAFYSYQDGFDNDNHRSITMSMGVCLAHHKMPVSTLFSTAQELLKSAKELQKQNKDLTMGTIDFMKLTQSTPFAGGLKKYREEQYTKTVMKQVQKDVKLHLTMRPYTWEQLEEIEEWISELKAIKTARGLLYELRDAVSSMSIKEAQLYYQYHLYSDRGHNKGRDRVLFREALQKRGKQHSKFARDMRLEDLYFYGKEHLYAPWHDLVELWDIWGEHNGRENTNSI